MKHLCTLLLWPAFCLSNAAHSQTPDASLPGKMPVIEVVPQELVDTIRLDSSSRNTYHLLQLRNTGDAPLVIGGVKSSDPCFCSSWPKEPILPGKAAELKIACPPMHAGSREQLYSIESNAEATYIFKVKRVGVSGVKDPLTGLDVAK